MVPISTLKWWRSINYEGDFLKLQVHNAMWAFLRKHMFLNNCILIEHYNLRPASERVEVILVNKISKFSLTQALKNWKLKKKIFHNLKKCADKFPQDVGSNTSEGRCETELGSPKWNSLNFEGSYEHCFTFKKNDYMRMISTVM